MGWGNYLILFILVCYSSLKSNHKYLNFFLIYYFNSLPFLATSSRQRTLWETDTFLSCSWERGRSSTGMCRSVKLSASSLTSGLQNSWMGTSRSLFRVWKRTTRSSSSPCLLGIKQLFGKHTGEAILAEYEEILKEWKIPASKVYWFTYSLFFTEINVFIYSD